MIFCGRGLGSGSLCSKRLLLPLERTAPLGGRDVPVRRVGVGKIRLDAGVKLLNGTSNDETHTRHDSSLLKGFIHSFQLVWGDKHLCPPHRGRGGLKLLFTPKHAKYADPGSQIILNVGKLSEEHHASVQEVTALLSTHTEPYFNFPHSRQAQSLESLLHAHPLTHSHTHTSPLTYIYSLYTFIFI